MAIRYGKQSIDKSDVDAVSEALFSDFLTTGPKVKEFEENFARYVGSKYAVAVSNGTAALHLACLAADLRENNELITTPMTFAASANCALYCGAKPVFVDIDENTGLIDENKIESKITSKTKIIIPVHYAGLPCNMEKIKQLATKYKLTVIEDACHAIGAKYKNSKIGDCFYSDMTVFSFHPVKHITTGEGGMITTNSEKLYERLKILRTHGITTDSTKFKSEKHGPWYQEMQELGFNYRLTDFQCALGINQLKKADSFINKRRILVKRYRDAFKDNTNIACLTESSDRFNSYHLFVIKTKDPKNRLPLFNYLVKNEIFCQVHYIPVYLHPYYGKLGYKKGLCKSAESFYETIISIPLYPDLSIMEQDKVIKCINAFFKTNKPSRKNK